LRLLRNLVLVALLVCGGALGWMYLQARKDSRNAVPVLTYHYFKSDRFPHPTIPPKLAGYYIVSESEFERQLDYLAAHGYHTVSFTELCQAKRYSDLPAKPVCISVDHEASDRLEIAMPALLKRHMTGTFFVVTHWLGKPGNLTAADVRTMADSGMDMQSHTSAHPSLNEVDRDRQIVELTRSKAELEAVTGRPVLTIAPPGGKWNQATVEEARKAGYLGIRTTDPGFSHVGDYVWHATTLPGEMSDADFARQLEPSSVVTLMFANRVARLGNRVLGSHYATLRNFLLRHGLDRLLHSPRARVLVLAGGLVLALVLLSALSGGRKRRR
jgi:peptidoglycan/xylan/chitin deacetylase (PgdA/CDA1 family)